MLGIVFESGKDSPPGLTQKADPWWMMATMSEGFPRHHPKEPPADDLVILGEAQAETPVPGDLLDRLQQHQEDRIRRHLAEDHRVIRSGEEPPETGKVFVETPFAFGRTLPSSYADMHTALHGSGQPNEHPPDHQHPILW